jgi:tetratricopeptide (TPR) repeat protein
MARSGGVRVLRIRSLVFAGVIAASSLFTATALAQTDDELARRHFRVGQAHYDNGDFAEAAVEFEEAYRLSQRPALLYNVYLAHRDALHVREAYSALQRYLERVPDAPDRDALEARLVNMERALQSLPPPTTTTTPETTPPETTPPETTPPPETTTATSMSTDLPVEESPSVVPWVVMGVGGAVAPITPMANGLLMS